MAETPMKDNVKRGADATAVASGVTSEMRQAADNARSAWLEHDGNDQIGALNAALDAAFLCAPSSKAAVKAKAAEIVEDAIERCRALHEYAGRPAWEKAMEDAILVALKPEDISGLESLVARENAASVEKALEAVTRERYALRDTNRRLNRRAQKSEGMFTSFRMSFAMWSKILFKTEWAHPQAAARSHDDFLAWCRNIDIDFAGHRAEAAQGAISELEKKLEVAVAENERMRSDLAKLSDPNTVHLNMLRGGIAKPAVEQIRHIYGDALACDDSVSPQTLDGYQAAAARTAVYDASKGPAIIYATGKMACEAGEAHQVVLKKAYHDSPADEAEADRKLKKELGDTLWYLSESCRVKGWLLSEVATENFDKTSGRKVRGTLVGSGDDR